MHDDPSFSHYPETILELGENGARIDLRKPVDSSARDCLARYGLAKPFAVITACNPHGRLVDDPTNRLRTASLAASIERLGLPLLRVDGLSPDDHHREPGFALPVDPNLAAAIAVEFEQTAFFWFDGSEIWIVLSRAPDIRVRLPVAESGSPGTRA